MKVGDIIVRAIDCNIPEGSKGVVRIILQKNIYNKSYYGVEFEGSLLNPTLQIPVRLDQMECSTPPEVGDSIDLKTPLFLSRGIAGIITEIITKPQLAYRVKFRQDDPDISYMLTLLPEELMEWNPQKKQFKLFDGVVLLEDIPEDNLSKGMVGAIVEVYFKPTLGYETDFVSEENGESIATLALRPDQIELFKAEPLRLNNFAK